MKNLKDFILSHNSKYKFKILEIENISREKLLLFKKFNKLDLDYFKKLCSSIDKNRLANFIFFLRILDFRLWEFPKNWQNSKKNEFYGLFQRVKNLINQDYNKIDFKKFKVIISPLENLSLTKLRFKLFKQSLVWLNKYYFGNFNNYFEENKQPLIFCQKLFQLKKFCDYTNELYFLKPNQLLYFEYILAFNLEKKFKEELEELTVFADYKLPQLFLNLEIIKLNENYLNKIKQGKIIKDKSVMANELRWASIILGEEISIKLKLPSYQVDNLLWNMANKIKLKIPPPKIKTIFY
ncbi:MAG: queuosine salvage family protein [Patescibacteria group bacterium]|nr:queuosine salvage family protein [Patescibacteria group bacterium]